MKRLITIMILICLGSSFAKAQSWYKTYSFDGDSTKDERPLKLVPLEDKGFYLFTARNAIVKCPVDTMKYLNKDENYIYKLDEEGSVQFKKILNFDSLPLSTFKYIGRTSKKQILLSMIGSSNTNCNGNISKKGLVLLDAKGQLIWFKEYSFEAANNFSAAIANDTILVSLSKFTLVDTSKLTYQYLDINGNVFLEKSRKIAKLGLYCEQIKYHRGYFYHQFYLDTGVSPIDKQIDKIDENLSIINSLYFKEFPYLLDFSVNDNGIKAIIKNGISYVIKNYNNNLNFVKTDSFSIVNNAGAGDSFLSEDGKSIIGLFEQKKIVGDTVYQYIATILSKYTIDGKLLWSKKMGKIKLGTAIENRNRILIIGQASNLLNLQTVPSIFHPFIYKTDTTDAKLFSYLKGTIRKDANLNCIAEDSEKVLRGFPIKIVSPSDSFYVTSNEKGEYFASVSDSTAKVKVLASAYWTTCQDTLVWFKKQGEEKTLNLPLQPLINCPLLEVSLATQRLRRCFDNVYTVQYCNRGTAAANNAYIEVDFDKWLIVKASSIPRTLISGNKYRFNIGEIKDLDCANFTITVNVNCDSTLLGQTHCSTAHIYPDSTCIIDNGWDKSSMTIQAKCNNGKVNVRIKNVGTAPTSQARQSIVIEDQIMFLQAPVNLNPGETKDLEFNPQGKTMRFMVEQAKNHPSRNPFVNTAIEGCGAASPSLGFVTQFGESDNEPWLDTDCRQNIGAYDPNEKSSSPLGYGALHQIAPNSEIKYQINFQNEGTDTAFTVILRDTLDNNLNISILQMGASSHAYTWELLNRSTLKVTFDQIRLTTKKQDDAKSQGFVRYRIAQYKDVALGKTIKNRAGIYFDFNAPIMTNTTEHLVNKNFVVVAVPDIATSLLKVSVAPNPFHEQAIFTIENADNQPISLEIFDTTGRVLHRQESNNSQFIYQNILPQGIYFYKIISEKGSASGKLLINK